MEERGVVEGRSWQSLKERFKRSIVKSGLDEQQEEQLAEAGWEEGEELERLLRRDLALPEVNGIVHVLINLFQNYFFGNSFALVISSINLFVLALVAISAQDRQSYGFD